MKRVFIDMDGVLATFHQDKSLEEIAVPGYWVSLEPQQNVVDAVRSLLRSKDDDTEYYILSAVLNEKAAAEKIEWNRYYLPELPLDAMLMVPYGETKTSFVKKETGYVSETDILVDDFTKNLKSWHGIGVKVLNRINNTKKTWQGYVINGNGTANIIKDSLKAIMSVVPA